MADQKLTELTGEAVPTSDDLIYLVDDPNGTPASKKVELGNGIMDYGVCQGRLTLTSNTPVTTSDVSSATGTYFTPYLGNQIGLYSASGTWSVLPFTEKYLSLNGYTASKPYDIFAYNSTGTVALESLIWTDGTTRATALAYQDGILVKSGDATRRYLGTIYINSSGGQTDDTEIARFVWNYYNRINRRLYKGDTTVHTAAVGAWRYWNNSSTHKVEYICGTIEDDWLMALQARIDSTSTRQAELSIGLDSVTGGTQRPSLEVTSIDYLRVRMGDSKFVSPSLGYHYLAIVEKSSASISWYEYRFTSEFIG